MNHMKDLGRHTDTSLNLDLASHLHIQVVGGFIHDVTILYKALFLFFILNVWVFLTRNDIAVSTGCYNLGI